MGGADATQEGGSGPSPDADASVDGSEAPAAAAPITATEATRNSRSSRSARARREDTPVSSHYAECFTLIPGRCFRMVTDPEPRRRAQPGHCEKPVVWRGRFRTRGEDIYRVDACDGHGDELMHRTRIR